VSHPQLVSTGGGPSLT